MLEIGGGLLAVLFLVLLNGFFVSAEFALVTVRSTRVHQLLAEGTPGARNVDDGIRNLDSYIAACQFGITLASLALGWIGEPALAGLLDPAFGAIGAHAVAVVIAFVLITALHVVAGELAPKGVALQYPERVALLVVGPLRLFRAVFRPGDLGAQRERLGRLRSCSASTAAPSPMGISAPRSCGSSCARAATRAS